MDGVTPVPYDALSFFVGGECVPKGSTKSFYIKKLDRVVTTNANKKTSDWELRIAHEAQAADAALERSFFHDDRNESFSVIARFLFSVPKSYPKKDRQGNPRKYAMTKTPDLDKLIRAVLDGITDVLLPDDAQVTSMTIQKEYVSEHFPNPGIHLTIMRDELRGH